MATYFLQENFVSSRKGQDGITNEVSPAIFLATTYDKCSEAWTACAPNSFVSIAVILLFKACVAN